MTSTAQPNDEHALIEASQAGDLVAVEELVRSYQTRRGADVRCAGVLVEHGR